jgi:hypothetical protein
MTNGKSSLPRAYLCRRNGQQNAANASGELAAWDEEARDVLHGEGFDRLLEAIGDADGWMDLARE